MGDLFLQSIKQSFSLADLDTNIDSINHFPCLNYAAFNSQSHSQDFTSFPHDNMLPHLPDCPESLPGLFLHQDNTVAVPVLQDSQIVSTDNGLNSDRKRKGAMDISPTNSCVHSSPQVSSNGLKTCRTGRGKKVKVEEEKQREVIHVRAKRGQATDSHSLAERVRRGKINERLRCLQDIVPGCYKTMGMAVMLDEIINYVQSLQNQVEFLSMKLTAASSYYDFNLDTDAIDTLQRAKALEAIKVENVTSQGLPPAVLFAPSFGHLPDLPPHSS